MALGQDINFSTNRKLWAVTLFLAMLVHTIYKIKAGILPELLWGCNVASFLIILGLWVDSPLLIGPAFLWHICLGDFAFAAGVFLRRQDLWQLLVAGWTSVVVHTLPTLAGLIYLKKRGIPKSSPILALALFFLLVPISHYFTPVSLNINMAHVRWEPLRHAFPGNWSYRIVFSSIMLALFMFGDYISAKFMGRPKIKNVYNYK